MSVGPRAGQVAEGVITILGPRVLGLLALFVRLAIGLSLLDIGMAWVMATASPGFRGPGMGGASAVPGLDLIVYVLPYAALAIGVGLVFGIFTTVCSLLACGIVLLVPLAITYQLVIAAGLPNNGFTPVGWMIGFGAGAGANEALAMLCITMLATPGFVALVLLSAPSINRYSFDALMFARANPPVLPPVEPQPRPEESSDATIRDVSAPG